MKTSGADASNLICPEERFHPHTNNDQAASRVLKSIQMILTKKYTHVSYADLLHHRCNAATIYLTFGRKDACLADKKCFKKYPLCGPTELLRQCCNSLVQQSGYVGVLVHGPYVYPHNRQQYGQYAILEASNMYCQFTEKSKLYFNTGENLDYLVIEGAIFAGLATPSIETSEMYCPPVVLHSKAAAVVSIRKMSWPN